MYIPVIRHPNETMTFLKSDGGTTTDYREAHKVLTRKEAINFAKQQKRGMWDWADYVSMDELKTHVERITP